uniref:Uncharacterized protein n=1 Tax=Rhizophora mucronata TaxID=61149 RepID=A0A2P2R4F2_RHIMU
MTRIGKMLRCFVVALFSVKG